MNRVVAIIILVAGIILVAYGINASNSVGSGLSRAFTGAPSDKSMWILTTGAILAIFGLAGSIRGGRSRLG